jgi:glycosyltransferase involved in cell wall biosynthesis
MAAGERRVHHPVILGNTEPSLSGSADAEAPRIDYVELAKRLQGDVLYRRRARGAISALQRLTGLNWAQAADARRPGYSVFVSLFEGIGIPLSLLDRGRTPHVLVAHNMVRKRHRAYQRATRYLERVDRIVVLARSHQRYLCDRFRIPPERVSFVHDKVDHRFWQPQGAIDGRYVLSVGQEQRDYATLTAAVGPLRVPTVVVPGSLWAPRAQALANQPSNVEVRGGLTYTQLRALYDAATIVVVPLYPGIEYAAGVNAVLEGMAMAKPVVVSATPGIADYVDDGETGLLVPPANADALRDALSNLLDDDAEASKLGANARRVVDHGLNLDRYVEGVAAIVEDVREQRRLAD